MPRIAILAAIVVAAGCATPHDDKDAYVQGKEDASHEVAAGRLAVEKYGLPPTHMEEYSRLLRERYTIEARPIAGCCVTDTTFGHARGFNEVMEAKINKRFGRSIWNKTEAEAKRLRMARVLEEIANEK